MTTKTVKRKRNLLWEADPHCYYCGTLTIRREDLPETRDDELPDNMATLDHVYAINHPMRDKEKYALACKRCNKLKGMIEQDGTDLVEQREKIISQLVIINKMLELQKETV